MTHDGISGRGLRLFDLYITLRDTPDLIDIQTP
jgi:hypothetical protein